MPYVFNPFTGNFDFTEQPAPSFTVGATAIPAQSLVGLSNGLLVIAKAGATPVTCIGFLDGGGAAGQTVQVQLEGLVTVGYVIDAIGRVYLSDVVGRFQSQPYRASGGVSQVLGHYLGGSSVYFRPEPPVLTV